MEIAAEVVRRVHGSQRWLQSNPRKSAQCLATAPSGLSATRTKVGIRGAARTAVRVARDPTGVAGHKRTFAGVRRFDAV
jgi:hypothetical protein